MPKILAMSEVSTKGSLHLPKKVRAKLNVKNGDSVLWILENDKIYVKKA